MKIEISGKIQDRYRLAKVDLGSAFAEPHQRAHLLRPMDIKGWNLQDRVILARALQVDSTIFPF